MFVSIGTSVRLSTVNRLPSVISTLRHPHSGQGCGRIGREDGCIRYSPIGSSIWRDTRWAFMIKHEQRLDSRPSQQHGRLSLLAIEGPDQPRDCRQPCGHAAHYFSQPIPIARAPHARRLHAVLPRRASLISLSCRIFESATSSRPGPDPSDTHGKRPMELTFHIPSASATSCIAT